jgi:inosine-uridine nucleoside N-ribohydrolase
MKMEQIRKLLSDEQRRARLVLPPGRLDMVLDTDTFNEIDDQFALVYAMLSPQRVNLQAVYAAPFHNSRSSGPEEGMLKSHGEILEVFSRMKRKPDGMVFEGSRQWMKDAGGPVSSPVATDLIARAMARDAKGPPLYVTGIGAITNVASAILLEPRIVERIVVVWLGAHPHYWPHAWEFNCQQDLPASQTLFDSGVPLVHVPCQNVAQKLRTTVSEMRQYVAGRGAIGDFLFQRFSEYEEHETPGKVQRNAGRPIAYCKEIWDVATVAWLVDPSWAPGHLCPSPILTERMTWSQDPSRHAMYVLDDLNRDAIFGDLFTKLASAAS